MNNGSNTDRIGFSFFWFRYSHRVWNIWLKTKARFSPKLIQVAWFENNLAVDSRRKKRPNWENKDISSLKWKFILLLEFHSSEIYWMIMKSIKFHSSNQCYFRFPNVTSSDPQMKAVSIKFTKKKFHMRPYLNGTWG